MKPTKTYTETLKALEGKFGQDLADAMTGYAAKAAAAKSERSSNRYYQMYFAAEDRLKATSGVWSR